MKPLTLNGLLLMIVVIIIIIATVNLGHVHCRTLEANSSQKSSTVSKYRKLDNFVEFTGEGDQLAVESTAALSAAEGTGNKRKILGTETSASTTGRQCPNVQKAVYPVIPVIIASLVGLIGAIIISAIVRLVFRIKNDSNDSDHGDSSEYGIPSYGRRVGKWSMFGFDLNNINFAKLAKNVLSAIEKVY